MRVPLTFITLLSALIHGPPTLIFEDPSCFFVDFVLKLPQNTVVASTQFISNIASLTTNKNNKRTVETDTLTALRFELKDLGDDDVTNLSTDDMRVLLKRLVSVTTNTPPESVKRTKGFEMNLFSSPTTPSIPSLVSTGTPKMVVSSLPLRRY